MGFGLGFRVMTLTLTHVLASDEDVRQAALAGLLQQLEPGRAACEPEPNGLHLVAKQGRSCVVPPVGSRAAWAALRGE